MLPAAESAGVLLALENHWGLTTKTENLLRIYNAVASPWLGINLDSPAIFPSIPILKSKSWRRTRPSCRRKRTLGGGEW